MAIDPKILEQIRTNDPDLTTLNLREQVIQVINENDAIILADALKDNHTLTSLSLWHKSTGNAGIIALAGALKNNRTLTTLFLADSSIGDAGATALADALKNNRTLTRLYLGGNHIGETGATALAGALKNNHTLTRLSLVNNVIGDAGVIALAGALKKNHTLNELNLSHNVIGDAGATALADALKGNTSLTILVFVNKFISAAGTTALANALSASKNIIFVDPATDELKAHYRENNATAPNLIRRIKSDPEGLTRDDRQEIQDRIPAILYIGEEDFKFSGEQIVNMLASIGIKPALGPASQRINAAREAQRQAAIEDPSQGI